MQNRYLQIICHKNRALQYHSLRKVVSENVAVRIRIQLAKNFRIYKTAKWPRKHLSNNNFKKMYFRSILCFKELCSDNCWPAPIAVGCSKSDPIKLKCMLWHFSLLCLKRYQILFWFCRCNGSSWRRFFFPTTLDFV